MAKRFALAFLIFGLIGFSVATFMSVKKLTNTPIPCSILKGCEVVTTSSYGTVLGIPVAVYGFFYYLAIVIVSILILDGGSLVWLRRLSLFTIIGLVVSMYLFSIQAFVLHAFCFYCLLSAASSTLLFITGMTALAKLRKSSPLVARS